MSGGWYFAGADGKVHGPVSEETLVEWIAASQVLPTDQVWREGMSDWAPVASTELVSRAEVVPPPLPPPIATPLAHASPPGFSSSPIRSPQPAPSTPIPPGSQPDPRGVNSVPTVSQPAAPSASSDFAVVQDPSRRTVRSQSRAASRASRNRRSLLLGAVAAAGGVLLLLGGVAIGLALRGADERHARAGRESAAATDLRPLDDSARSLVGEPGGTADSGDRNSPPVVQGRRTDSLESAASPPDSSLEPQAGAVGDPESAPNTTASPANVAPPTGSSRGRQDATALPADDLPATTGAGPPLLAAGPTPEPSSAVVPHEEPLAAADQKQSFFQDIRIQRRPTFVMQGLTIPQQLDYRIVSRIDLQPRERDGTRRAILYVEETRLEQADELSRAAMAESLEKLKHRQYTFVLNARNEVTDFQGDRNQPAALPIKMNLGQGFMVTSVIDDDGWKELVQLTLFQPEPAAASEQPVKRAMTHDWGPLGSWYGTTEFVRKGLIRLAEVAGQPAGAAGTTTSPGESAGGEPLQRIDYTHDMTYVPPGQDGGGLPLRIKQSDFRTTIAGGSIAYDPQRRRVAYVQERFEVTGTLTVEVLGQASAVELREQQVLTIRVTDDRLRD